MTVSPVRQIALGLVLNVTAWIVAWSGPEPARYHTFFPLWLGYIIVIDGLIRVTTGTSLIQRLRFRFIWLFVISMPIWWLFEAANTRLDNWTYVVPRDYSWLWRHIEASISFSTVVPAIFVTSELVRAHLIRGRVRWLRIAPTDDLLSLIAVCGAALFAATMVWPRQLFPIVWISLFLAIDPLVQLLGGRSVNRQVRIGRWDTVLVLFVATLICGFFWEFWNFWSQPKWTYNIRYADWLRLFEMPALGFGGYLPFGLEIYALVALADRILRLGLGAEFRFDKQIEDS